jgi:hypothetical protein
MQTTQLIGLVGPAGVGKDTVRHMLEDNFDFEGLAFADPLRAMLAPLLDQVHEHHAHLADRDLKEHPIESLGTSGRHLMQTLGDWGRAIEPDWWVRILGQRVRHLHALDVRRVVVSDVRFANEADWVRSQGGKLWRISRTTHAVRAHSSEQAHNDIACDLTIDNNGTLDELWLRVEQHVNLTRSPWAQASDDVFAHAVRGLV